MSLIGFSWQQLGAMIVTSQNVDDNRLISFAVAGGRWIVPVVYGDDATGPYNLEHLGSLRDRAAAFGIRTGLWANCFGGDPEKIAADVKAISRGHNIAGPLVFDAEADYQGNTKMAYLTEAIRKVFPLGTRPLAISTNSLNDSQVYNGRKGGYPVPPDAKSFRDLNIHVMPQWYSSPAYYGPWTHADQNMKWVSEQGMIDNWRDEGYADKRAVAKSQIHGTLEVTGLEGASLQQSLWEVEAAQQRYGYGKGISIYTLENAPESDFALLKAQKGVLFS